ncbi:hypothetical protein QTN94_18635 [Vibrio sp. M250220]|uniref:hypothetical protein n=1 Tax=Vibrio sp. M250220 TaxID=3020894 RepID=UPI002F40275B
MYNELLNVAVSEHALFDVRYYAAWECVKRALPKHVPSGDNCQLTSVFVGYSQ